MSEMSESNQTQDLWSIARMMQWMQSFLESHDDPNPRISTQWLVSYATNLSRTELFMQMDRPLSKNELDCLRSNVKRRAKGEPLQYITGEAPFRYLNIKVKQGVLIPRPETEVLVSELLAELPKPEKRRSLEYLEEIQIANAEINEESVIETGKEIRFKDSPSLDADGSSDLDIFDPTECNLSSDILNQDILVADLCTGTGCIACSLAYEHPSIRVIATDISNEAVSLAKENVAAFNLADRVSVIECDLGEDIDAEKLGCFDAVISNPPYIPSDLLKNLSSEVVDYESKLALDGGDDGLELFRQIAHWGLKALKPNGVLATELHEDTLDNAKAFAEDAGYKDVRIVKDLANKPRVLIARKR